MQSLCRGEKYDCQWNEKSCQKPIDGVDSVLTRFPVRGTSREKDNNTVKPQLTSHLQFYI